MLIGVTAILCGCFLQILFYLCSRNFSGGALRLLAITQIYLGAISALGIGLVIPESLPPLGEYLPNVAGGILFFMFGQGCLFVVLQKTEASRIAPLLGLKIIFVGVMGYLFFETRISGFQWLGIVITVSGGWVINSSGNKPHMSTVPLVLLTCLGYCLSDLNLNVLVHSFPGSPKIEATLFSLFATYLFGGIVTLPFLPFIKGVTKQMWREAIPHSLLWVSAMTGLYLSFAYIGIIFTVVLQSTRGLLAIIVGYFIGKHGSNDLEEQIPRTILLQRIGGAVAMLIGIGIFVFNVST